MLGLECRILILERWAKDAARTIAELIGRIGRLEDKAAAQGGAASGGGGGAGFYVANNLTLAAASGTWPSITPDSTTADVYTSASGVLTLAKSGATILNWLPDASTPANRQILASNGDGTFSLVGESCSAG